MKTDVAVEEIIECNVPEGEMFNKRLRQKSSLTQVAQMSCTPAAASLLTTD